MALYKQQRHVTLMKNLKKFASVVESRSEESFSEEL